MNTYKKSVSETCFTKQNTMERDKSPERKLKSTLPIPQLHQLNEGRFIDCTLFSVKKVVEEEFGPLYANLSYWLLNKADYIESVDADAVDCDSIAANLIYFFALKVWRDNLGTDGSLELQCLLDPYCKQRPIAPVQEMLDAVHRIHKRYRKKHPQVCFDVRWTLLWNRAQYHLSRSIPLIDFHPNRKHGVKAFYIWFIAQSHPFLKLTCETAEFEPKLFLASVVQQTRQRMNSRIRSASETPQVADLPKLYTDGDSSFVLQNLSFLLETGFHMPVPPSDDTPLGRIFKEILADTSCTYQVLGTWVRLCQ